MNRNLRKAHKFSWLLLIVIIPLIIIFAVKDLTFSPENNSAARFDSSEEAILKTAENNLIKVSVYSNSIEIILKSPLKNASSIVYNSDLSGNKDHVIGQVSTVGIYRFNIKTPLNSIILYDELKGELITKLDF